MLTYIFGSTFLDCTLIERCINSGAHSAKAPVTKATHVNPNVDNTKLLLKKQRYHLVVFRSSIMIENRSII